MYAWLSRAAPVRLCLQLGMCCAALMACTFDRSPASGATLTAPAPIRLRDPAQPRPEQAAPLDAGEDDACAADACVAPNQGCDDDACACDGSAGESCASQCGNGVIDPGETCDDGASNGMAGRCDLRCSQPDERLLLRQPGAGERLENPVFFDWELVSARAGTRYCHMLMTDREHTPEDLIGEQAFYAGTETEQILTLSSLRYRGPFSFVVIAVACSNPNAECIEADCFPGQECPLPCRGRTIQSEVRGLLGVRP